MKEKIQTEPKLSDTQEFRKLIIERGGVVLTFKQCGPEIEIITYREHANDQNFKAEIIKEGEGRIYKFPLS